MKHADVERDDRWRTLCVGDEIEPRPSRADEVQLTADARERDAHRRADQRAELNATLAAMLTDLESVEDVIGRVVPGDHCSDLRAVRNGLRRLRQSLETD